MVAKRKIVIANKDLIEKYNSIATNFYDEIDLLKNQTQNLIRQRDALLPRLMSGRLAV